MKYYKGYPITKGLLIKRSTLKAQCPYCNNIEYFNWSKACANPTRRQSHCKEGFNDYYYIYIPHLKEVSK